MTWYVLNPSNIQDFEFTTTQPCNDTTFDDEDLFDFELEQLSSDSPIDYTITSPMSIPAVNSGSYIDELLSIPSLTDNSYLGLLASYTSISELPTGNVSLPIYQSDPVGTYPLFPIEFSQYPTQIPLSSSPTSCGSLDHSDWTSSLPRSNSIASSMSRSSSINSIDSTVDHPAPITRRKSKGRSTYPCTFCPKVFDRSYCLNSHLVTHTGTFLLHLIFSRR
jgi:hypothetical protein